MDKHVVIIWWRSHAEPTVTPRLPETAAINFAACVSRLSPVADTRVMTWHDAHALIEAEAKERTT